MLPAVNPTNLASYKTLEQHYAKLKHASLTSLFESDSKRFNRFSIERDGLLFDYSKHFINKTTKDLLLQFADDCELEKAISLFKSGERINQTENRAVMHMALRSFGRIDFPNAFTKVVQRERDKMRNFCKAVHEKKVIGFSGKSFRFVVNIGIGGSDLGPVMATEALRSYADKGITSFFVSNVDGTQLAETLKQIKLDETLFIIASKTFTTQETMANAHKVRQLLVAHFGTADAVASHTIALSTNTKEVEKFGISKNRQFVFWDWVGGRFSMWGSIGLSIALAIGYERFEEMLKGAEDIDMHFFETPFGQNIPIMMALLRFIYCHFFKAETHAILPYAQYLHRFPAYLQQAIMESNGKSVDRKGKPIDYPTSPIIWGESGTNGQHAFYQLLHQGSFLIPIDFIAFAYLPNMYEDQHQLLLTNCIAQSQGLMQGRNAEETRKSMNRNTNDQKKHFLPHKIFRGNKPSTTLLFSTLTPFTLGQLVALYEHSIFVEGILLNIFSFDQWGVELGKILAQKLMREENGTQQDSSTQQLLQWLNRKISSHR